MTRARAAIMGLLMASSLRADTVLLDNGALLEGKYLGERDGFVEIEEQGRLTRTPSNKVLRIELAYPGVPICFRRKESPKRICSGKLFLLYGDAVEIIGGPGDTQKEKINLADLTDLEFRRRSDTEQLLPRVKPGARVRLVFPEGGVQGTVEGVDPGALSIRANDGQQVRVREEQVVQLELPRPADGFLWSRLVPGLPQYRRQETRKGGLIAGSMAFFLLGAGWEQLAANREIERARANTIYRFTGLESRQDVFDFHRRNARMLVLGALLTYSYHLSDEFIFSVRTTPGGLQGSVTLRLR